MRIGINARFLLPHKLEGIGWHTFELVQRMAARHPDDVFVLFFDRPYAAQFVNLPNIKPVVVAPPARHPLLFVYWYEVALANALRQHRCDVCWSPDNFLSLRTDVPTVLTVHDIAYRHYPEQLSPVVRAYYRYFTPRFLRKARAIMVVSKFVQQDLQQQFAHIDLPPIQLTYNGNRAHFCPLSEPAKHQVRHHYTQGHGYFIYTGALQPRKNIARLIAAFETYKKKTNSPQRLLLVGRAWDTRYGQALLDASPYKAHLIHVGYVPDTVLAQLMGAADALVYVSLFEGFGMPLLEAMHCEVPIITANVTSMPEIAGDAALLVNPTDIIAIAQAMQHIQTDTALREKLIQAGRLQRTRFSWDESADVLYAALQTAAKSASL